MTDQPTNQPSQAGQENDPLVNEAYALALAFGVRTLEVDIRGIKVKVREFTPDDLHPLYSWLIQVRSLYITGQLEGVDTRALIEQAIKSGTGILNAVTDGVIPADITLPVSVIAKLVDAILAVNEDFFEVLPSLMRLFGGLPGLVGGNQTGGSVSEPDATPTESEPTDGAVPETIKQPTEFPEPALAQPDAGHSSSEDSGAAATP